MRPTPTDEERERYAENGYLITGLTATPPRRRAPPPDRTPSPGKQPSPPADPVTAHAAPGPDGDAMTGR